MTFSLLHLLRKRLTSVPWEGTILKGNGSSSNHQFSGDMLLVFRVVSTVHAFWVHSMWEYFWNFFQASNKQIHVMISTWTFDQPSWLIGGDFTLRLRFQRLLLSCTGSPGWEISAFLVESSIPLTPRCVLGKKLSLETDSLQVDISSFMDFPSNHAANRYHLWTPKPRKMKVVGPKNMGYYP